MDALDPVYHVVGAGTFWFFAIIGVVSLIAGAVRLTVRSESYRGKHVLITGASTGLGHGYAALMVDQGATVSILSRDPRRLEEARLSLQARATAAGHGGQVSAFPCDVTSELEVARAVSAAVLAHGAPAKVLAAAGLSHPDYFLSTTNATFRDEMSLNYFGTLYVIKACLPFMVAAKNRGQIVLVSSALGLCGFVGYTPYCPTKYALRGLADSLRNELLPLGIAVSIFYPGNMKSPGYEAEEKSKPREAKAIEGASELMEPSVAAKILLDGVSRRQFAISNELLLRLLITAAVGPAPSPYPLVVHTLLSPLMSLVCAGYRWHMDRTVCQGSGVAAVAAASADPAAASSIQLDIDQVSGPEDPQPIPPHAPTYDAAAPAAYTVLLPAPAVDAFAAAATLNTTTTMRRAIDEREHSDAESSSGEGEHTAGESSEGGESSSSAPDVRTGSIAEEDTSRSVGKSRSSSSSESRSSESRSSDGRSSSSSSRL